jgi:two-component system, NtrC family, sensor kinase
MRGLLFTFSGLFGGAVLVAALGLALILTRIEYDQGGAVLIIGVVTLDLLLLFMLGNSVVRRVLVRPMQRLGEDARQIASGDYRHKIRHSRSVEVQQVHSSVTEMADRLIADQELLADNVASLEATNRDLIEARSQVIQAARLASVGTLAAGIAHEVGNPLGAIMGFADVARSRIEKQGGDSELLDAIRDEALRIDRIVRGLLDYARPSDKGVAPHRPVEVLEHVFDLLESQGKFERVQATWGVIGEPPEVLMEFHQFEQVVVNLILNALDALAGHPDPQISIQLLEETGGFRLLPRRRAEDPQGINYMHRRRIAHDDGGRGIDPVFTAERVVVIRVDDNGPGIPEENLEHLFDPFFTTKEPGKGTGLGLAICLRLVEGMGGSIMAENRPEGGASFIIRLQGASALAVADDTHEVASTSDGPEPMEHS